ncbi:MAG: hypothetical protein LAP87_15175 [Acidobacteriia bacterium]|nr:hypothetical protein [Terriglobia bacterium]
MDAEAQSGTVAVPRPAYGTVVFEYTGRTGMAVMGPVTRATYRFDGFGARVSVDGRDGVALATVRALRRV